MINKSHIDIINALPYGEPFLFVDSLERVDKDGAVGSYTFKPSHDFYRGHFEGHPITPGVILTETMAQIGLVCLGIFLLKEKGELNDSPQIAMTSSEVEFLLPVYPSEKVTVTSEKVYFRFGKLKCKVKMRNEKGNIVCQGTIAGMIKPNKPK